MNHASSESLTPTGSPATDYLKVLGAFGLIATWIGDMKGADERH